MSFLARMRSAVLGFRGYTGLLEANAPPVGYLALLLLIALTVSAINASVSFRFEVGSLQDDLRQGPDFRLQGGKFVFDGPMPFRAGEALIIDTTGATSPDALRQMPDKAMLVTGDTWYQRKGARIDSTDLSQIPFDMNRDQVANLIGNLAWLAPLGYAFLYPFQFGVKLLDGVILALFGMMYAALSRRQVSFGRAWSAGLYALTLPTMVQWLLPVYRWNSWWFLVFWGLGIFYTVMGLRAYLAAQEEH